MNPFIFSFIALCLTQGAVAQYQSGASSYGRQGGYQQRKMSPSPQSYGAQTAAGYGQASSAYQPQQQQQSYEMSQSYEQPAQYAQRSSPSSASSYEERTPAGSSAYVGKAAAPSYARQSSYPQPQPQQQQSQYQQPAASSPSYGAQQSYAPKAAPKYEEPIHPPMPFAWGYDINDGYGGAQYHKESGDEYGKRTGSYGYTDAYGIYRQVDYVADEHGFRATIKTNEPGTANESPADVELHAYEPPSNYYAGNTNSYGAPASSYGSGKHSASYAASAPVAQAAPAYPQRQSAAPASSYGAPAMQPRASSYKAAPASYSRPSSYESGAQYSSSAIVPVYQKAAAGPAAAAAVAKKY